MRKKQMFITIGDIKLNKRKLLIKELYKTKWLKKMIINHLKKSNFKLNDIPIFDTSIITDNIINTFQLLRFKLDVMSPETIPTAKFTPKKSKG
jgi:hypothetical protein